MNRTHEVTRENVEYMITRFCLADTPRITMGRDTIAIDYRKKNATLNDIRAINQTLTAPAFMGEGYELVERSTTHMGLWTYITFIIKYVGEPVLESDMTPERFEELQKRGLRDGLKTHEARELFEYIKYMQRNI